MIIRICFGARNGKPINPVVCSFRCGMWSCYPEKKLEGSEKALKMTFQK